jgi:hypothetical protein
MVLRVRSTETVQRLRLAALVALVAVAGCSSGGQGAATGGPSRTAPARSASPAATVSASPTGSPSADAAVEFTVDGAGPYQLGAMLDGLRDTPGLEEIDSGKPPCAQTTTARGTNTWQDIHLSFHTDGVLYLLVNRSPSIPTPSGAWLGTPLAQLKTIYAGVTSEELVRGPRRAYLVTTLSGRGILFELDAKTMVSAMLAAEASYLKGSFQGGTGYC